MENTTCPQCGNKLYHNEGVSKKTGKKYENYKCGQCEYIKWVDTPKGEPQNTGNQIAMEELANLTKGQKEIWKLLITIQNRVEDIYNNLDRK